MCSGLQSEFAYREYALSFAIILVLAISIFLSLRFLPAVNPVPDHQQRLITGLNNYHLDEPDERHDLPGELKEISGLAFLNPKYLACVNDEQGVLFIYDPAMRAMVKRIAFGPDGDYEGVTIAGDTAYILKSNGQISMVNLAIANGKGTFLRHKPPHLKRCDAEGLVYHPLLKRLLIACKENPHKLGLKGDRVIYSLDPGTGILDSLPWAMLRIREIERELENFPVSKKKHLPVKPSGLAFHPVTGQLYMLASVGKLLMVLDNEGKLLQLVPLNARLFRQPEGICFGPDGTLYIASEGQWGSGYILAFHAR